ncbi:MAG: Na-translocating system protein MpsC family protein [Solirubrobacteraceae bacterium]
MGARTAGPQVTGDPSVAISRLVVRTIADYTGRGPTRARATIGPDVITVILDDSLTKAERALVRDGAADEVVSIRRAFQRTMAQTLILGVEEITGRTVSAFLSDNHVAPDYAAEVFVLTPLDDADPATPDTTDAAPTR